MNGFLANENMEKLKKIKKRNCVICNKEFLIEYFYNYNKKTCSNNCSYELAKQITKNNQEKLKNKTRINICKNCKKTFKYKSLHTKIYCSSDCQYKYLIENRKGKNNPNYKDGKSALAKYGGKRNIYTAKHFRACQKYRKKFLDKNGYLFCEKCNANINKAKKFEVHHIVFASEAPRHEELHNDKNLILLCIKCHNKFHGKKREIRKSIVKERELEKLFNRNLTS